MASSGRGRETHDVYVANLPQDITEGRMKSLFDKFGEIHYVHFPENKRDDGFKIAFVKFLEEVSANKAVSEMRNYDYGGAKTLFVKKSIKRDGQDRGQGRREGYGNRNQPPDLVSNHQSGPPGGAKEPSMMLQVLRTEQLVVQHVDSPTTFYAQVIDEGMEELAKMSTTLNEVCPCSPKMSGIPQPNQIYGALFSEDGTWYRCKVVRQVSDAQSMVQFIDYGNTEVSQTCELVDLPGSLTSHKPYAQYYTLYGLKAICDDKDSLGFTQGVETLHKLTEGKLLQAAVYSSSNMGITPVIVEYENMDINQEMMNLRFAESKKPIQRQQQRGGDNKQGNKPRQQGNRQMNERGDGPSNQNRPSMSEPPSRPSMSEPPPIQRQKSDPTPAHRHPGHSFHSRFDVQSPPGGITSPGRAGGFGKPDADRNQPIQQWGNSPASSDTENKGQGMWGSRPAPQQQQQQQPSHQPQPRQADPRAVQEQAAAVELVVAELQRTKQELSKKQMEFTKMQVDLGSSNNKLKYTEEHLQGQIEYLKGERDAAVIELASTRGHLKNLENSFHMASAQLAEANISAKIKHLMMTLQKVKMLRSQLPTDRDTRDIIEEAIMNCTTASRRISLDKLTVIGDVEQTLQAYRAAQETIKTSTFNSELATLREQRDECRSKLHADLGRFIEIVSKLPLEDRIAQVEDLVNALEHHFGAFLKIQVTEMNWSDGLDIYREWRARKYVEFQEVRTGTNTCHNAVNSSLQLLQKQLSLDLSQNEGPHTMINLDDLLTRFHHATQKEIAVTDMENSADMSTVAMVVQFALSNLKAELHDIKQVKKLLFEYRELWMQIKPWLTEKLDVTGLHGIRKTIKNLKSKLRHKLADKQDLEENEDTSDKEELCQVETDLADIRLQLQAAFLQDDQLLAELADLNDNHFPELSLLHPDMGINMEGEYGGLVKVGRSLDQFHVSTLPGCTKKSVMQATHCQNECVIKEYIVSESVGVKKSEFLRRAMAYNSVINPGVLPVEAVFFDKNEKHVYVMTTKYKSLEEFVMESTVTHKVIYYILRGVLRGLHALHEAKLTHGAIHPRNILVESSGRGILAEYDFTKSLRQRAEHKFTTSNGLTFVSPEVKAGTEVTRASDIFNLGLLVLWLYFPEARLPLDSDGVPDTTTLNLKEPSLNGLLIETLCPEVQLRPSTSNLMSSRYFCTSPSSRPSSPEERHHLLYTGSTDPCSPPDFKLLKSILKCGSIESPEKSETLPGVSKTVAFTDRHQSSPVTAAAAIVAEFSRGLKKTEAASEQKSNTEPESQHAAVLEPAEGFHDAGEPASVAHNEGEPAGVAQNAGEPAGVEQNVDEPAGVEQNAGEPACVEENAGAPADIAGDFPPDLEDEDEPAASASQGSAECHGEFETQNNAVAAIDAQSEEPGMLNTEPATAPDGAASGQEGEPPASGEDNICASGV